MPVFIFRADDRTSFHESNEPLPRLSPASDPVEEERVRAALGDALRRFHVWMHDHQEHAAGTAPRATRTNAT